MPGPWCASAMLVVRYIPDAHLGQQEEGPRSYFVEPSGAEPGAGRHQSAPDLAGI